MKNKSSGETLDIQIQENGNAFTGYAVGQQELLQRQLVEERSRGIRPSINGSLRRANMQINKLELLNGIAEQLQSALNQFVQKNHAIRKNAIGFHVLTQSGLNISELKANITEVGDFLHTLISDCKHKTPVNINTRVLAGNLQHMVDHFRMELIHNTNGDHLNTSESISVLRSVMELRENVNELAAKIGVVQAALTKQGGS